MITMTWPQYERGECTVDGFVVDLTELETDLLLCFLLRTDLLTTHEDLIEFLYCAREDGGPEFARSTLAHKIMDLRHKVGAFRIENSFGRGFIFRQEPDPWVVGRKRLAKFRAAA